LGDSFVSRSELEAVLTGGDPEAACKGQPEVLSGLKTTLPGDGVQFPVCFFKPPDCCFKANSFEKICQCRSGFPLERMSNLHNS
jgi:hypothetical protein